MQSDWQKIIYEEKQRRVEAFDRYYTLKRRDTLVGLFIVAVCMFGLAVLILWS